MPYVMYISYEVFFELVFRCCFGLGWTLKERGAVRNGGSGS